MDAGADATPGTTSPDKSPANKAHYDNRHVQQQQQQRHRGPHQAATSTIRGGHHRRGSTLASAPTTADGGNPHSIPGHRWSRPETVDRRRDRGTENGSRSLAAASFALMPVLTAAAAAATFAGRNP